MAWPPKEIQRRLNLYLGHRGYAKIPVDGKWGPSSWRAYHEAWALLGYKPPPHNKFPPVDDRFMDWLLHPSHRLPARPGYVLRGNRYWAAVKKRRAAQAPAGLAKFDGFVVMPAVARELNRFRRAGWSGGIVEQLGACRTAADQRMLRSTNNLGMGGIVAAPGTSEHECYRFKPTDERGAADVTYYTQARQISDRLGSKLKNTVAGDEVHFDFIRR